MEMRPQDREGSSQSAQGWKWDDMGRHAISTLSWLAGAWKPYRHIFFLRNIIPAKNRHIYVAGKKTSAIALHRKRIIAIHNRRQINLRETVYK